MKDSINIFTEQECEKIQERWDKFQPRVDLITFTGDTITGQLIFTNEVEVVLYPCHDIILGTDLLKDLIYIPFSEIDNVLLRTGGPAANGLISGAIIGGGVGFLGGLVLVPGWSIIPPIVLGTLGVGGGLWIGNKIQNSNRSAILDLDQDNPEYAEEQLKLKKKAIFTDSIVLSQDINHVINHSRIMRHCFPDKHFRISFGLNVGRNVVKTDLEEMFASTTLPPMNEYRHEPLAIEFYDFSWRFQDRFIVGGQLFLNMGYTYLWSDYNYSSSHYDEIYYNYTIQLFEGRLYFDYVFRPVDRFFTKHFEFLAGGGIIFASPSVNFNYGYTSETMGDWGVSEFDNSCNIKGVQLRSAFHYYPFPGFSLSAGLEGNLHQSITIPARELPTSAPGVTISMPEHKLNFSAFRFKIGASLYF